MGIFYGDIHYGIKISKKIVIEDNIFTELVYEIKFYDNLILLNDLDKVKDIYLELCVSEPDNYQYELFVDIFTTHDGIISSKGWQIITKEQMKNFIDGLYKIDCLN